MRRSRRAAGAIRSSIRSATFCCAGFRTSPTSRCRSWLQNWRQSGCGLIPLPCHGGSGATVIAIKKTLLASEQHRPDVHAAREQWITHRQPRLGREGHRLIFVDETGTTTKMTRLRGRDLKGRRLRAKAPFGHWKTQTFIAGLRRGALTAPFVVDQPMNRRIFETWSKPNSLRRSAREISLSSTISRPIRATPPRRPSGPKGHGSCSCRPTVQISILSRWPSQNSKPTYALEPCEPSMISGERSAISAICSNLQNAPTSSTPPGTVTHERPML